MQAEGFGTVFVPILTDRADYRFCVVTDEQGATQIKKRYWPVWQTPTAEDERDHCPDGL